MNFKRLARSGYIAAQRAVMATQSRRPDAEAFTRSTMYRALSSTWERPDATGRVLSISGSEELAALTLGKEIDIVSVQYPQTDWCDLRSFGDHSFDYVVADQVLEHVLEPRAALAETVRVLRVGGSALITTCLINGIHDAPADYWRFTPHGLAQLVPDNATCDSTDGWGNPLAPLLIAAGFRSFRVHRRSLHPLSLVSRWDSPDWPVVTWVVLTRIG